MNSPLISRMQTATRAWAGLGLRERRMVAMAGGFVLVALVWMLAIAPAIKTLKAAPAQHEMLDAQLQSMRKLAAQARGMQNRPAVSRADALRTLQSSLQQRLGSSAQLNVAGDRVTVVLKGAAPEALAQWLGQARVTARAVATQSRLARGAAGWDGTVVLDLPAASP
jgi:general secretion pathway protein M